MLLLNKLLILLVTCPLVTAPDSGSVSFSTLGGVTSASYNCSSEYSLAGPETRICQSNNLWTDEDPTCSKLPSDVYKILQIKQLNTGKFRMLQNFEGELKVPLIRPDKTVVLIVKQL